MPCQSEVFCSKVSFTLPIYINGHRGRERQEEVGPRLLDGWVNVALWRGGRRLGCVLPARGECLGKANFGELAIAVHPGDGLFQQR